jgi:hypothetical protein
MAQHQNTLRRNGRAGFGDSGQFRWTYPTLDVTRIMAFSRSTAPTDRIAAGASSPPPGCADEFNGASTTVHGTESGRRILDELRTVNP